MMVMMMVMMVMMMMMMTMMMMTMMTMTMIGCLPGDEDVTWFGDDDPVLPLGQGVEQKREALESLARGWSEVNRLVRGFLNCERFIEL